MSKSLKDRAIESAKALGSYNGDRNTIHNRLVLERSKQSIGIISSIMTTDNVVYAIIARIGSQPDTYDLSEKDGYYNCDGDPASYSPFELMIPIINVQLDLNPIDPKQLIGGKVLVSEIKGVAMKAEYIGKMTEVNESPLNIPRSTLATLRNYVGGYMKLDHKDPQIRDVIDELGIPIDVLTKLNTYTVSEWDGNVVRLSSDAVMYRDTGKQVQGEIVIQDLDNLGAFIRNINRKDMKTKECHLPTILFSAR